MAVKEITAPGVSQWRFAFKVISLTFAVCVGILGSYWAYSEANHFLMVDSRFLLAVPDPGEDPKSILMDGVKHSSRQRIAREFANDFGRSIYNIPIAERRRRLLAIGWIKEARVARVWPNQLRIEVVEREPIAFLELPADGDDKQRPSLIDADGVIMGQEKPEKFDLPVLTGISSKLTLDDRKLRVRRLMKVLEEAGDTASRISEVDIADPDNLRVMLQMKDRAVNLILGDRHFGSRLARFIPYFEDVNRKAPDAASFDLRLEDRITAIPLTANSTVVSSLQKKAQEEPGGH